MIVKPRDPYATLQGRVNGVAYGSDRGVVTANWWHYPLMSSTPTFDTVNDVVRGLDQNFPDLDTADKDEWEDWVDEWLKRELCELWKQYQKARDVAESTKAGYVNCNSWRATMGIAQTNTPPVDDYVPLGDTVTWRDADAWTVSWNAPAGYPAFPAYLAVWAALRNNAPGSEMPAQKFSWLGYVPIDNPRIIDVSALVAKVVSDGGFRFLQLGCAPGIVGSCPFELGQMGRYIV